MRRAKRARKKSARKKAVRRKAVRRKVVRRVRRARRRAVVRKVVRRKAVRKAVRRKAVRKAVRRKRVTRVRKAVRRAKKGGGGGGGGGGRSRLVTVTLNPKRRLANKKSELSVSRQDRIRWRNQDDVDHTIEFTSAGWPFVGARTTLFVAAGGYSAELTMSSSTTLYLSFNYKVVPSIVYKVSGPPDGPAVISDD